MRAELAPVDFAKLLQSLLELEDLDFDEEIQHFAAELEDLILLASEQAE